MSDDPMAHLARLRRPGAVIGWIAALYLLTTIPLSIVSLEQGWRHPVEGMTAWMVAFLVLAAPLSGLATVLAARAERAATGLRHPMRGAWLGVSLGAFLVAHWAIHLLWTPIAAFWALTSSWNREDHLVGAFLGLLAWAFALGGAWLARSTARRLRARDWEGVTAVERPRSLPRIPTPWLAALAYGWAVGPLSLVAGAVGVDDDVPLLATFVWCAVGVVPAAVGATYGAWLDDGFRRGAPARLRARALELFGSVWVVHWTPVYLVALAPLWNDHDHEARLAVTLLAATSIVLGMAAWSWGRSAGAGPADAPGGAPGTGEPAPTG